MRINKRNVRRLAEAIKDKRKELEERPLQPIKELMTKKRIERICHEQGDRGIPGTGYGNAG
jgi:hypothetical protein